MSDKNDKKKASKSGEHKTPTTEATTPPAAGTTALAKEGEKAVSKFDFGTHAGLGMDTVAASLIKLPYLMLVQKGTPGVDKKDDVLHNQTGNFYDSLTGKIYDGERGFVGVAISTKEEYVERTQPPENKFKGKHHPNSEVVKAGKKRTMEYNAKAEEDKKLGFGKVMAPVGTNMLVETHCLLVVLAPVGADGKPIMDEAFGCVQPFKSTGIPGLSKWISGATVNRSLPDGTKVPAGSIPMCANEFRLYAKYREEGKTSWYLPMIEPRNKDIVSSIDTGDLYKLAIEQYEAMQAGKIAVAEETFDAATGGGEAAAGPSGGKDMDW